MWYQPTHKSGYQNQYQENRKYPHPNLNSFNVEKTFVLKVFRLYFLFPSNSVTFWLNCSFFFPRDVSASAASRFTSRGTEEFI